MTSFTVDSVLDHPRLEVVRCYRDRLPDMVDCLPNVERIETLERRSEGARTWLLNRWVATGKVPLFARKYVKPDMLTWLDDAVWDEEDWSVSWRFRFPAWEGLVDVSGTNRFYEEGPRRTRVVIDGTLAIDGGRIPGLPASVAAVALPEVERFILALVKPNLRQTARGVDRFLAR